ncbi:MAG: hypothetical protein R3B09_22265 [Nannocystaceae bacterium]
MSRRLAKEEVLPALRAWAYCSGYGGALAESLPRALGWLRALWGEGYDALPLDLVHDLGVMLALGRGFPFASARDLASWPEAERGPRLDYEDRILGRWVLDPSLLDAHVAIAALAKELQDRAIAHAVGLALGPASRAGELSVGNPAHLRSLAPEIAGALETWPKGHAEWEGRPPVDEAWIAWALEERGHLYEGLSGRLFSPEDLWELAHLEALPSESTRLALREIHREVAGIAGVGPAVAMAIRRRAQEVAVDDEEADHYPAGGFDALSTRGRFENLVRSEVGYVDEGREVMGTIDLFDVRFAQGELLFYTRDESPLYDARREVHFVIDHAAELRHKHPDLEAQTLVLVDALALRLQADLVQVFGPAGAEFHLRWRETTPADAAAAAEEEGLVALTLADEVAHHRVTLGHVRAWDEAPTRGLVIASTHSVDPKAGARVWVRVGDEVWRVDDEAYAVGEPGGMRALLDRILRDLFE